MHIIWILTELHTLIDTHLRHMTEFSHLAAFCAEKLPREKKNARPINMNRNESNSWLQSFYPDPHTKM